MHLRQSQTIKATTGYDKYEQEIHLSGMIWVLFEVSVLVTKP